MPFKRAFDISFSLIALVLTSPLFLIISALLYFSSGKIFYRHERIGRGGKIIRCIKFRTMYLDADKKLYSLLDNDPILKAEWDLYFKLKNDPRVIPIGRWLRKTSLDELPQFFNVLKGDLSVVGPRPCVKEEVEKYFKAKAPKILSIRPGLTGLWQISGRNDITWEIRVKLEELYTEKRSFAMDLKIIAKTIIFILFPKGAY